MPNTDKLAIKGGSPVRSRPFPMRVTMREEEKRAVEDVMDSDVLSAFLGAPGEYFNGGPRVLECERAWAEYSGYRHAITVNSWTSGLVACVGALRLQPGDELITPPYTMSASATCAMAYGAIPVFADITPDTFCIDPASVRERITERTRAIMAVHLFGHPAPMDELGEIADEFGIAIIEDAAQAPGATYRGRKVGALRDVGGFSLNYHKHVHAGEGGIIVTDNDDLALRCQLIRNHGEVVAESMGVTDLTNTVGWNLRLTELQCAIATVQLSRLPGYLDTRRRLAERLGSHLAQLPGLTPAFTSPESEHSFYLYPIRFDESVVGISRSQFVEAVAAELPAPDHLESVALTQGYVRPVYLQAMYQQALESGSGQLPLGQASATALESYRKGSCPVAEKMHESELLLSPLVREPLTEADIDDLGAAITKVVQGSEQLLSAARH